MFKWMINVINDPKLSREEKLLWGSVILHGGLVGQVKFDDGEIAMGRGIEHLHGLVGTVQVKRWNIGLLYCDYKESIAEKSGWVAAARGPWWNAISI